MKYAEISTKQIVTSPRHSKSRCQHGEIVNLAKSIKKHGVLAPIHVKPLIGGGYEIISGNRRYCASKLAEIDKIPCIVLEKEDNPQITDITLSMFNSHDSFELADKIKRLFVKSGKGAEYVSEALGIDVPLLLEYLTPTCMSEIERRIARDNSLSNEIIRKISSLPTKEDRFNALTKYIRVFTDTQSVKINKHVTNAKARRRASINGLGFFENTLKRSLEILESAGLQTSKKAEERCGEVEYRITVKK